MSRDPASPFRLEYAWRSDRGRVRSANEDAVRVQPELGLLVVADGVGGARAGEVASNLAAEVITERFRQHAVSPADAEAARRLAEEAVEAANVAVWRSGRDDAALAGMGTTVVLAAVVADRLVFAYVGDSRLYRLRRGRLEQVSRDHTFIQEVVDQGLFRSREDALRHGIGENLLTRALGSSARVDVSSGSLELSAGDLILLCTDGLTGMLSDDRLCRILMAASGTDLDRAAKALIRLANKRGGADNITLALLRVGARSGRAAAQPPTGRASHPGAQGGAGRLVDRSGVGG